MHPLSFDNKANVGGGGAIDLVMHIAGVDFSVCVSVPGR